jgi:hypothetical protein
LLRGPIALVFSRSWTNARPPGAGCGPVRSVAARNAGATAARWRAAGRIFAVTSGGKAALFPGFQFDAGGQPVPVIADILTALADRLDPWSLALWFTGDNPRLGGLRPVDTLNGDPDAVLAAARALADDLT